MSVAAGTSLDPARVAARAGEAPGRLAVPILSLVVPTFNERQNLEELVRRVDRALSGISFEIIFVDDDSPDGTAALAKQLAETDPRIRCLRRVRRRGLAGACIEGMLSSSSPYVGVMDGDLQHDETILPRMLSLLRDGDAGLVVGSRHVDGGSASSGLSAFRMRVSAAATSLARRALQTDCADLMSGFFLMRRDVFEEVAPRLSPAGFRILADIIASSRSPLRIAEVGYRFRPRTAGQSKLDAKVALDFIGLMLNKATGGFLPVRFIFFVMVGLSGIFVHFAVLTWLHFIGTPFVWAQGAATVVAMTTNYVVNNQTTYRDARRRGWAALTGLVYFYVVCSIGAVANIGTAELIYGLHQPWWVAGLVGVAMGSVWNYWLSSVFVWRDGVRD